MKKRITFGDVKQKKLLGKGGYGMVYLAKDDKNNKYAIKIEKILEQDNNGTFQSKALREIDFARTMFEKYPNHFLKLYDWEIESNCKHMHEYEEEIKSNENLEDYDKHRKELENSKYCFRRLYSFINTDFEKYLSKQETIDKDEFYDFFIQIVYVIYIMKKEGYVHSDFHFGNIGMVKTKLATIDIFGKSVPTHGFLIQAIDYGNVLHKKYGKYLTEQENKMVSTGFNDIHYILSGLFSFREFAKKYRQKLKNKNIINITGFNVFAWGFDISKYDRESLNIYLKGLDLWELVDFEEEDIIYICFKIIFYEKYEREMLTTTKFDPIEPLFFIPKKDVFFIIKNMHNIEKILFHFLEKYYSIF